MNNITYVSLASFNDKDIVKNLGFQWNGDIKKWTTTDKNKCIQSGISYIELSYQFLLNHSINTIPLFGLSFNKDSDDIFSMFDISDIEKCRKDSKLVKQFEIYKNKKSITNLQGTTIDYLSFKMLSDKQRKEILDNVKYRFETEIKPKRDNKEIKQKLDNTDEQKNIDGLYCEGVVIDILGFKHNDGDLAKFDYKNGKKRVDIKTVFLPQKTYKDIINSNYDVYLLKSQLDLAVKYCKEENIDLYDYSFDIVYCSMERDILFRVSNKKMTLGYILDNIKPEKKNPPFTNGNVEPQYNYIIKNLFF